MPYIKREDREKFDELIFDLAEKVESVGDLNYIITKLCHVHWLRYPDSYRTINDIMGVLACAREEFYRRVAVPYEELKIAVNGDVFAHEENETPLEDADGDDGDGAQQPGSAPEWN